jgi:hypothetical protein
MLIQLQANHSALSPKLLAMDTIAFWILACDFFTKSDSQGTQK